MRNALTNGEVRTKREEHVEEKIRVKSGVTWHQQVSHFIFVGRTGNYGHVKILQTYRNFLARTLAEDMYTLQFGFHPLKYCNKYIYRQVVKFRFHSLEASNLIAQPPTNAFPKVITFTNLIRKPFVRNAYASGT